MNSKRAGVVMEYCENGSLRKFMSKNQQLLWNKKIEKLIDIASGMQFLHSKGVIHRDLKSKVNLLLNLL